MRHLRGRAPAAIAEEVPHVQKLRPGQQRPP